MQIGRVESNLFRFHRPPQKIRRESNTLFEIALGMENEGNWKDAFILYEAALKIDPENTSALLGAGSVCCKLGDQNSAKDYYKRFIVVDRRSHLGYYSLGVLNYNLGWYFTAKLYYKEALRLQPKDPNVHLNLGLTLEKLFDKGGAAKHLLLAGQYCKDPELSAECIVYGRQLLGNPQFSLVTRR